MSSVYGRLGYNFDSTQFNGADVLSSGVINFLNNSSINLSQWQINDLANATVGGYYQNPHATSLNNLTLVLNNFIVACNTQTTTFTTATSTPANLISTATTTLTSISNFLIHTNNISGVTNSSNTALYPDLNSALAVGRQILNITNKTDSVQNNTPILGNFTSLYVANTITASYNTISNDYNNFLNTIYVVSGNNTTNITDNTMNVFISHIQSVQTLMDTRRNADTNFYINSLTVSNDYQKISQFSNLGATQNSLISIIGTAKLHNSLGY